MGVYTVMESSTLVGQSSRMTPGQVTGLELWDIGVYIRSLQALCNGLLDSAGGAILCK